NTMFTQGFNASYTVPLQKLPATDWTNLRFTYGATYTWTGASRLAYDLGNTIGNTQTKQVNGELNFVQLYNKQRWLRAVNQPKAVNLKNKPPEAKPRSARARFNTDLIIINEDTLNVKDFTDTEIDSLRDIQRAQEKARLKAEKEKRKQERKAARKLHRNTTPRVNDAARLGGRLLTMVKRVTFNYTENAGTMLPGYMDSTRYIGINDLNGQPGLPFVYGYQPNRNWLESKAGANKLSRDSLFNAQFQQQY